MTCSDAPAQCRRWTQWVNRSTMATMATRARLGPAKTHPEGTVMVGVKGVWPDLHRRIRIAAAEEGVSYAKLFDLLLTERSERQRRQRAQQASPLHRPRVSTDLDDETVAL